MIFNPGEYYVGDLIRVLPSDDLRTLFSDIVNRGNVRTGTRELIVSKKFENNKFYCDYYWATKTPSAQGTFYDQLGNSWGFDWGVFGCMPFDWAENKDGYHENKIKFENQFNCEVVEDLIQIGYLKFSLNQA